MGGEGVSGAWEPEAKHLLTSKFAQDLSVVCERQLLIPLDRRQGEVSLRVVGIEGTGQQEVATLLKNMVLGVGLCLVQICCGQSNRCIGNVSLGGMLQARGDGDQSKGGEE